MRFILSTKTKLSQFVKAFFLKVFVGYCRLCHGHIDAGHKLLCLECLLKFFDKNFDESYIELSLPNFLVKDLQALEALLLIYISYLKSCDLVCFEPFFQSCKTLLSLYPSHAMHQPLSWAQKDVLYLGLKSEGYEHIQLAASISGAKSFHAVFIKI
jgi:hypothetical protein